LQESANYREKRDQQKFATYTLVSLDSLPDLSLDAVSDLVNASPLVLVLGSAANHAERLEDVDNVVDSTSLDTQLPRAAVQQEHVFALTAVGVQEAPTQFAEGLFLSGVGML